MRNIWRSIGRFSRGGGNGIWILCWTAIVLSGATNAAAQSATSYELRVYQGAAPPIRSVPISAFVCGQAKASGSNANPTRVVWDDPANAALDCVAQVTVLVSLPVGSYTATLVAINEFGSSPESAPVPFVVGVAPAAPTNLRIIK